MKSDLFSKTIMVLATVMVMLSFSVYYSACDDSLDRYSCMVYTRDHYTLEYRHTRNIGVDAKNEEDAINECNRKITSGYCSSCRLSE